MVIDASTQDSALLNVTFSLAFYSKLQHKGTSCTALYIKDTRKICRGVEIL